MPDADVASLAAPVNEAARAAELYRRTLQTQVRCFTPAAHLLAQNSQPVTHAQLRK